MTSRNELAHSSAAATSRSRGLASRRLGEAGGDAGGGVTSQTSAANSHHAKSQVRPSSSFITMAGPIGLDMT